MEAKSTAEKHHEIHSMTWQDLDLERKSSRIQDNAFGAFKGGRGLG